MLGQPIADIAERIDMARQVDAVAERRSGFGASGDDGEVENGERNHGRKLVCVRSATKALTAQIRAAPGDATTDIAATSKVGRIVISR